MENLKFIQTWGISQFKENHHVEKIEIKKNDKTGKCFFTYGFETGACSVKVNKGEMNNPVISQVCTSDGDIFYLLHQKAECNAITLAVL